MLTYLSSDKQTIQPNDDLVSPFSIGTKVNSLRPEFARAILSSTLPTNPDSLPRQPGQ